MAKPFRRKAIFVTLSAPREQGGQGGDATPRSCLRSDIQHALLAL